MNIRHSNKSAKHRGHWFYIYKELKEKHPDGIILLQSRFNIFTFDSDAHFCLKCNEDKEGNFADGTDWAFISVKAKIDNIIAAIVRNGRRVVLRLV